MLIKIVRYSSLIIKLITAIPTIIAVITSLVQIVKMIESIDLDFSEGLNNNIKDEMYGSTPVDDPYRAGAREVSEKGNALLPLLEDLNAKFNS